MSREFSKISPKVWRSKRFRSLGSDDPRYLLLYLMTCQHQSSAGCFRMPDAYGAADLDWPLERLKEARLLLAERDLIAFDAVTEEYFMRGWFAHNKPMNASHQKAIMNRINDIESDSVREVAEEEFGEAALPQSNPTPVPSSSRLTDTAFMSSGRRV